MRITNDLIFHAPAFINPVKNRELDLRGILEILYFFYFIRDFTEKVATFFIPFIFHNSFNQLQEIKYHSWRILVQHR